MQILLSNAKLMHTTVSRSPLSEARFQSVADALALEMAQMDIDEMGRQLGCPRALAAENWQRYQNFHAAEKMPAVLAYNGQAYKHLKASDFSEEDFLYAQNHLWITCFLYGLLRPLDGVVPYRMEHTVRLSLTSERPIHSFWKDRLTELLIRAVQSDDGILLHLSTKEYEHLFDWKRVGREVKVIQPLFYVRSQGKLKMQAVWAKACRGAMTRWVIQQRCTDLDELRNFAYEGFVWAPQLGEEAFPHFVREG